MKTSMGIGLTAISALMSVVTAGCRSAADGAVRPLPAPIYPASVPVSPVTVPVVTPIALPSPTPVALVPGLETLRFGSSLTGAQVTQIQSALVLLQSRHTYPDTSGLPPGTADSYTRFFGGETLSAAQAYLKDRVRYLVSQVTAPPAANASAASVSFLAYNWSALFWFGARFTERGDAPLDLDGLEIPIESPRVGIVELTPDFFKMPPVAQLVTLLHEARHSDCRQDLPHARLQAINEIPDPNEAMKALAGEECGHFHVLCPTGNEAAGQYACDGDFGGGYTAQYLAARAFAARCPDCSPQERQVADLFALDAASRLVALPSSYQEAVSAWLKWSVSSAAFSLSGDQVVSSIEPFAHQLDAYIGARIRNK